MCSIPRGTKQTKKSIEDFFICFFNIEKSEAWISAVRELLDETPDVEGGVTRIASGDAAVRILGKGAEPLLKISEKIQEMN